MGEIVQPVPDIADMIFVEPVKENLAADPQHRRGADQRQRREQLRHEGHQSAPDRAARAIAFLRSEEHTSEPQSLMRTSYAVFCSKKKKRIQDGYSSRINTPSHTIHV